MSYSVLVEPADDQRVAFARWCLAQEPKIMTATAFGSEVSAEQFKAIPEAILVGAYIDGRLYRHVQPDEPVTEAPVPPAQDETVRTRRRPRNRPNTVQAGDSDA